MAAAHRNSADRRVHLAHLGFALALLTPAAFAQDIHLDLNQAPKSTRPERVSLQTDAFTVTAGKPAWIELRFHIAPGFHINSHKPDDETLIPTTFQLDPGTSAHVLETHFPAGTPYHLQIGTGEILSTYAGDFNLRLELAAQPAGQSILTGKLRYQACDNASCFPPRNLTVRLALSAR